MNIRQQNIHCLPHKHTHAIRLKIQPTIVCKNTHIPLVYLPISIQKRKNPRSAGSFSYLVAYRRCHRGAALPSIPELFIFLARFQLLYRNT